MKLDVHVEAFRLASVFRIARGARTEAVVVSVTLEADGVRGRGECVPYARYGETPESVKAAIEGVRDPFDHAGLPAALPAGAARNALDCALWDLAAKRAGRSVAELAGINPPASAVTAYTLSLDEPEVMEAAAREKAGWPLLKTKLGGAGDVARIEAVRRGAPDATIIVDANEGWDAETYQELAPVLVRLGVSMVEQPMPAGDDAALAEMERPLPVCADEACHDRDSLPSLQGKYDLVNIKLDKTGGLTEAMALRDAARADGHDIMIGCMVGTSLAMAPAHLLTEGAAFTDLDAPLLLAEDRTPAIRYDGATMYPADPALWG